MNTLLTTVSGYFSRALILGAFLPVIIFVTLFILLAYPFFPADAVVFKLLNDLDTQWKVVAVSFITIVLSGLLFNLNNLLIRIYEGYPWRNSLAGKWMTQRKTEKYRTMDARQKGLRTVLRAMKAAEESLSPEELQKLQENTIRQLNIFLEEVPPLLRRDVLRKSGRESISGAVHQNSVSDSEEQWKSYYSAALIQWNEINRQRLIGFPQEESLILPTRLGNVIRNFEYYPKREYGIDAIAVYPRLVAKIDKDYAGIIDDAKTSFDFMLNCSFLSVILALVLLFAGLLTAKPFFTVSALITWIIQSAVLLVLSRLCYAVSVSRAAVWGENVQSSFDLYRNDLLKQLGIIYIPRTKVDERVLWTNISKQILYGDYLEKPRFDYPESVPEPAPEQTEATRATGTPANAELRVLRTLNYLSERNVYQVVLDVSNIDKNQIGVTDVVVVDTVPGDKWFFRTGSAVLKENGKEDPAAVTVSGCNPYRFEISKLDRGQQITITYEILPLIQKRKGIINMSKSSIAQEIIQQSLRETTGRAPLTRFLDIDFEMLEIDNDQLINRLRINLVNNTISSIRYHFPDLPTEELRKLRSDLDSGLKLTYESRPREIFNFILLEVVQ